ncbi:MAG: hypothetical protein R2848_01865 [Thermomicrobiales bacterium]
MFAFPSGSPLRSRFALALAGVIGLFSLFALLAEEVVMDRRYWLDRTTSLELRQFDLDHRSGARHYRTGAAGARPLLRQHPALAVWHAASARPLPSAAFSCWPRRSRPD